jgi:hypothetical protein
MDRQQSGSRKKVVAVSARFFPYLEELVAVLRRLAGVRF